MNKPARLEGGNDRGEEWASGSDASGAGPAAGKVAATARLAPSPRTIARAVADELTRRAGDAAATIDGDDPDDVLMAEAGASSGQALPADLRRRFESSLGTDLGAVRVHTGEASVASSAALGARAYAIGQDIHFGAGEYAPGDPFGIHLLAHEVAHTVQQAPGSTTPQAKLTVSSPGDDAERDADRAADAMIRDQPVRVAAAPPQIRRFASSEHRQIGDAASGGRQLEGMVLDDGSHLSYGDMVALGGDYFESVDEVRQLLAAGPEGQRQVRCARAISRGASTDEFPPAMVQRVRNRSNQLSVQNLNHFATSGAMTTYESGHEAALRLAFLSGITGPGGARDPSLLGRAFETEAFANHFLTDMFSAGHIRTPRQQIVTWYGEHYRSSPEDMREYLVHYVVGYTRAQSPGGLASLMPDSTLASSIRERLRAAAGPVLDSMSLGQIVSLAHHNADGAGLEVQSQVNAAGQPSTATWHAVGDGGLNGPQGATDLAMVTAAARVSHDEVVAMSRHPTSIAAANPDRQNEMEEAAFQQRLAAMRPFRALAYLPHEAPGANPTMTWEWNALSPAMVTAINAAMAGEIARAIRAAAAGQAENSHGVPVRAALLSLADHLAAGGIGALRDALAHNYAFRFDAAVTTPTGPAGPVVPPVVDQPGGR